MKSSTASVSIKESPVWGKNIVKDRPEISEEERIRAKHKDWIKQIIYKINTDSLPLAVLDEKIL